MVSANIHSQFSGLSLSLLGSSSVSGRLSGRICNATWFPLYVHNDELWSIYVGYIQNNLDFTAYSDLGH